MQIEVPSATARLVAGLFLLVFSSTSLADHTDDYIREEMERQRIPGLALAIIRDGRPIKVAGYGLANAELNVPVRTDR
jgi:CubicO group peptidase (beta-lactamase class C family)